MSFITRTPIDQRNSQLNSFNTVALQRVIGQRMDKTIDATNRLTASTEALGALINDAVERHAVIVKESSTSSRSLTRASWVMAGAALVGALAAAVQVYVAMTQR